MLESIDDKDPTVNEKKQRPNIIHYKAIISSKFVYGVISPYPTPDNVVKAQ